MLSHAANFIKEKINKKYSPKIGMILGSGLGALADEIQNQFSISDDDLPFQEERIMAVYKRRKKTCYFTDNKVEKIDWKNADLLKRFISDRGKILPRRITGTKAIYQRELAVAIKRARHMALLPFVREQ